MRHTRFLFLFALLASVTAASADDKIKRNELDPDHAEKSKVGLQVFKEQVRGTLVKHCLDCHGGKSTKADFDLSSRKALMKSGLAEKPADESHLMELIRHESEPKMPFKADKLTDDAITAIAKWIDSGAPYDKPLIENSSGDADAPMQVTDSDRKFWSFQPLRESTPPENDDKWIRTEIDRFILAKLRSEHLEPNEDADRITLIRRSYLDLLGMPPTPTQVDAFLNDKSDQAFEHVIDHLLASSHYGERWARHWMDVARFAESTGFEHDYDRNTAFHYRDFLIRAFNADMRWDQMVRYQLAGDEIAPQDPLALMATGFMAAGVFPTQLTEAEFESARYDELDDIVATTGVAFLGLSVGCARCHDHKFDPIPTRDYYSLAATFATAIRSERSVNFDNDVYQKNLAAWDAKRETIKADLAKYESEKIAPQFQTWLTAPTIPDQVSSSDWNVLQASSVTSRDGATLTRQPNEAWLASGKAPANDEYTFVAKASAGATAIRIEAFTHKSMSRNGPGRAGNGNFALGHLTIAAQPTDTHDAKSRTLKLIHPRATHQQDTKGLSVASSIDGDKNKSGWAVDRGGIGKDQAATFQFAKPLSESSTLTITMRFHVNTSHSLGHFRISTSQHADSDFDLGSRANIDLTTAINTLQTKGKQGLSADQVTRLREWFAMRDQGWRVEKKHFDDHIASKPKPNTQNVLIYTEGVKPMSHHANGRGYPHFYPQVHLLKRGDAKQKQEVVQAGTLQVIGTLTDSAKASSANPTVDAKPIHSKLSYRRTAFANWLTDDATGGGQLLARVIVNRLWQHHFGRGIVATPNDFGFQGARPTHPELLDWLANDLIAHDWNLKRMHKLIMQSSVYRQSSSADDTRKRADIDNLLWWRFQPRRLEAEAIRDSLLSVSGRLDAKMFGPGTLDESMRRRSVYFKIKRSRFVPMMQTFDWPEHLVSIGQRSQTAIAPQALALMNGQQVRGYAESLAKEVMPNRSTKDAIVEVYRRVLARSATDQEIQDASQFLAEQTTRYGGTSDPGSALTDFVQAMFCCNEFLYLP